MLRTALGSALALSALLNVAAAGITEIRIDAIEPFAEGKTFGEAGSYLRIKGVAKGELDPAARENAAIVDLDRAPRNARGLVEYEVDLFILRPADPAKGNRVLFYEVLNRGNKQVLGRLHDMVTGGPAASNDPKSAEHAGNGFLFERGYTVVWSGWDPDVPNRNFAMGARFPMALEDGKPVIRRIRDEIQIGTRGPADVEVARLSYPAVSTDTAKARLTERRRESDPRAEIPANGWEFADNQSIRLLPKGTKFAPITIYELWYEATQPKVTGIGYAATRDVVAFLRYERADRKGTANPLIAGAADGPRHAIAFGGSQSGRFLRHYLELGMNKDEHGRRVFDGVFSHIAGVGKVFANHTFAMAGRTATQHQDRYYPENWFPFSAASLTDPFTGKTASLLKGDASDPLLIETNTSTEYWQKGASLLTTDPTGMRDVELPANARAYLIAGTQHTGRVGLGTEPGPCANLRNPHNPAPALRALVVALEQWVTKGIAPPASRVPSIAAGTAVDPAAITMPAIPNFAVAPAANAVGPSVDWVDPPGSRTAVYLTASAPAHYGVRVPAVDTDGNEVAGIRLPPIAVPVATYTGWNVYKAEPSELCDRDGSYVAFARSKAEREATGDPRPSIEERYASRETYVIRVKAVTNELLNERLLLPADAAAYVKAAEASDRF
jgi:hypothetical protein